MPFSELGLPQPLLAALHKHGYTAPTPVQRAAIPAALAGQDLLVSSHTGSGKTAAFLLPSLARLAQHAGPGGPRVLVLAPTRELAQQVEQAARRYGQSLPRLRTVALVGGAPYGAQLKALAQPVDIVIATPGRLIDHMTRGRIDLARLEVLVLDEADRMLDMGFVDDIEAIVARTPATRQTLLFSATLDGVVGSLARRLTRNPQRIEITTSAQGRAPIAQRLLFADDHGHKTRLLDALLREDGLTQAIVFTATKKAAEDLAQDLRARGFSAAPLHGDMRQHHRNTTLRHLHAGRTRVLVATDVAARGIDVAGISHVINFDAPRQAADYVHRIGRTGRAGRSGVAVTLAVQGERRLIREIERYTGERLQAETLPGLAPKARPRFDSDAQGRGVAPTANAWGRPGRRGNPRHGPPRTRPKHDKY